MPGVDAAVHLSVVRENEALKREVADLKGQLRATEEKNERLEANAAINNAPSKAVAD